ncbi:MAG: hypothetical protein AB7P33_10385 [Dehalococcoidia bacterium]
MARQERPTPPPRRTPRPRQEEAAPAPAERKSVDFDPKRVSVPQIAVVGFLIGILFHACVAYAVLSDGSGSSKPESSGGNIVTQPTAVAAATATPNPGADRTDCNAIRADPTYRSEAERQWFLNNCVPR